MPYLLYKIILVAIIIGISSLVLPINKLALILFSQLDKNLEKETGIDFQRFTKNRMSKKDLILSDKRVFPEDKPRFKLSLKDTHRAVIHTTPKKKRAPRRKLIGEEGVVERPLFPFFEQTLF